MMHELLPWYVNGTLETAEAAAFERHMSECDDCRRERTLLEKLRAEVEAHGDAVLGEHPTPEELVDALRPEGRDAELDAATVAAVSRHLALCATCAQEARWVRGEDVASGGTSVPPRQSARPHRLSRPWGVLAAAAAVVIVAGSLLLLQWLEIAGQTGLARMNLVEPTQRAADVVPVVAVTPDTDPVHLLLPVDLAPAAFPATLEIQGPEDRTVYRNDVVEAGDLYGGAFLLFTCRRVDCPDGTYLARLMPLGQPEAATEYPFRLTTSR